MATYEDAGKEERSPFPKVLDQKKSEGPRKGIGHAIDHNREPLRTEAASRAEG